MILLSAVLGVLAIPALLPCGYLLLLALASRRRAPPAGAASLCFDVIVPAHDEESGIARTVQSLLSIDYPSALRRVIVVADNCGDGTAARARAAGAVVLTRDDPARRGKGFALAHAFERSLADGFADAAVVVDADSVAPANLLSAFAARLQRGALAVQAGSGVLNAGDSWRTQLMQLGFSLFNGVRSLARENLGLSCGLRGNGMCLAASLLRAHPWNAFSLVEDLEYGISLGRAGLRVHYAGEASVQSAMTSSPRAAAAQRRRWELGRLALTRRLAGPLLLEAIRRRSVVLLDLAIDLLVPPLSFLALAVLIGIAAGAGSRIAWLVSAACLAAYVLRGWALSGIGLRGFSALARAPFYVLWKLAVLTRRVGAMEWVRTPREEPAP
jgi:cellulose synthase/poly-beta-1,6-N-acetylglucosamine synthase-like glycosyltransferase